MSDNLQKTENALRDLIETLLDGHKGFIELEKNLKNWKTNCTTWALKM
jgi:hypothetical protein